MVNALTGGGTLSLASTDSLATNSIAERMYVDMRKKTDAIGATYDRQIEGFSATAGTLNGRLGDLQDIQTAAENSKEQVTDIKGVLLEMRTLLSRAERHPDSKAYYAKQFNEKLKEINEIADRYTERYNLVGRVDQATLLPAEKKVQVSDYVDEVTFQGLYVGTTFNIVGTGDSEGMTFQNSPTANIMEVMNRPGGKKVADGPTVGHNNLNRIQNMTMSGDQISFDLDGETSFTGTLEKGGLGLMPAWYYDGFTDLDAARQAVRDADKALRAVTSRATQVSVEVDGYVSRVQRDLDETKDQIKILSSEKTKKVSSIEEETRQQFSAIQSSLSQAEGDIARFKQILAPITRGPFTDILA